MAILPVPLARVSDQLRSSLALSSITKTQQDLLTVQNELTTGKRVNAPSDDPGAAAIIQTLNRTLQQRQAYTANLQQANEQLSGVDSTLGDLNDLLQQAQNIAQSNVGSDTTADQRKSQATVVQSLIDQAVNIGNKQVDGVYLFGGDRSNQPPFTSNNGTIRFTGSANVITNADDASGSVPLLVNGANVFGTLASKVAGSANLSPNLTPTTRIVDLAGASGDGVRLGTVRISDGTTSADVDLSKADTVTDVVNAINAAGLTGATAALGSTGITLSGGGDISVNEVGGGTTAADLGILTPTGGGAGATVTGQSLQPRVTPLTPLAALNGGAGIDTAGLTITNGGTTVNLSFAGLSTVQDVVNAINGSKAGVTASINAAGTGIDVNNPTQGASLTISENGGTTAADLGLRSFSPTTTLAGLNGGRGVGTATGADLTVTRKDGSTFAVDVDGAHTVQDVIDAINAADGGNGVTASFSATTNGIELTDSTGGGGSLSVAAANGSTAAKDLGILGSTAGATLTGTDVNPVVGSGIIANLQRLRDALQANDVDGITGAGVALQKDYTRVTNARGANGATLQEVQGRQNQIQDEDVATKSFLSDLQDTDFPSAITKFQLLQTALQAQYQVTAKLSSLSLMDFLR